MARRRYDQRVLALVEVRGEARDFEQAKAEFVLQGWPVVEEFGRGEGPSADVLTPDPRSRLYWVEVRLFGARNARTERAAGWRVQGLAKTAVLEMYVRRTRLVDPDREQLEEYRSHTTAHRRDPRRATGRWTRAVEGSGHYDTGSIALGTPSEARRLARMATPGNTPARTDLDVRMSPKRGRWDMELRREDDFMRRLARMFGWLLAMAFAAGCFRGAEGAVRWPWLLIGLGCLARGIHLASGLAAARGRLFGCGAGALGALLLLLLVYGVPGVGAAWTPGGMLFDAVVVVTLVGIWLLVRQWTTWSEWLTATVPLAVTLAAGLVVASGSVLHGLYGNGLDLTPQELDVPGLWQVVAGAKLVTYLGLGLLGPALWGIARHFHVGFTRPGEYLNVVMYVLLYVVVLASLVGLATDNAATAVERTKAAAAHRREAPAYFGVRPEWTCVQPTVPVAALNAEGGLLDPRRPYLFFGVADDMALLWNTDTDAPLKQRTDQVRLVPAKDPARPCGV
ncbi:MULTISPECIES: NnrS multi-domain protein [unclassified Streptomyces]|uniref:NnrS multi-domain protein n=1 Tax=unclassified Streptomyces TaxID=2593676 RepID=UPI0022584B67|nr:MULTISPECIES: NnrS multi-domain protein [unclassified Streptomyces]MCX4528828.1 NnrS multi-domain protein [Streptomyces sp. NBC_01551]MCX4540564.1 NnrS multi-domain protein [Streptomyces sp. NBC_01565]